MAAVLPALFADAARRRDPTNTLGLRKAFRATAKLRLRQIRAQLRTAIVDHDLLGLNRDPFGFQPPEARLAALTYWLKNTLYGSLLVRDWMHPYVPGSVASAKHSVRPAVCRARARLMC